MHVFSPPARRNNFSGALWRIGRSRRRCFSKLNILTLFSATGIVAAAFEVDGPELGKITDEFRFALIFYMDFENTFLLCIEKYSNGD